MTPPNRPDPPANAPPLSLRRWSQRKHAARRDADKSASSAAASAALPEALATDDGAAAPHARSPQSEADSRAPKAIPPEGTLARTEPGATPQRSNMSVRDADVAALPPIHTLTPDSDFTRFFDAKAPVDDALKRAALKALLRDPRFNVMDGLDTYIGDYTRPDPIPEGVLQRLVQAQSFVTQTPAPGTDPAQTPVDAGVATPVASIPPPADPPVAGAAEQAATTFAAKPADIPADGDKPTTT